MGRFASRKSPGKQPIKKRGVKRFLSYFIFFWVSGLEARAPHHNFSQLQGTCSRNPPLALTGSCLNQGLCTLLATSSVAPFRGPYRCILPGSGHTIPRGGTAQEHHPKEGELRLDVPQKRLEQAAGLWRRRRMRRRRRRRRINIVRTFPKGPKIEKIQSRLKFFNLA